MLLVMAVILVMAVSVLFGATVGLHSFPVNNSHSSLGIVQGLEIFVVVAVDDVSLWHHLQVGPDAVVTGTFVVAEVDDATFIDALVGWFDSGEAEFMGDVASYDFHNLTKTQNERKKIRAVKDKLPPQSYVTAATFATRSNYRLMVSLMLKCSSTEVQKRL